MVDVAVYGSRGYLGRTLVALLDEHPGVDAIHPVSSSHAGRPYSTVVPSMGHLVDRTLVAPGDPAVDDADVMMLATASDEAQAVLAEEGADSHELVVDLSRAHRLEALNGDGGWVYGWPELPGGVQPGDAYVANPGCYPTATLLATAPALAAGLVQVGPIVVDGKSGVSGAGATPRPDLHFPETNESLRAYAVEQHDHTAEMEAAIASLAPTNGLEPPVRFTPHLVPQNRGLLVTAYLPLVEGVDPDHLEAVYEKVYPEGGAVDLGVEPDTSHVRGSNRAQVAATVDEATGLLVARAAIDNLVKGGAGSAVQNMNQALGFPAQAGLPWAGVAP